MKYKNLDPYMQTAVWILGLGLVVFALEQLWPDLIPFGLFDLWKMPDVDMLWLVTRPLAYAGIAFAIAGVVVSFWRRGRSADEVLMSPSQAFWRGVGVTLLMSLVQEILLRWLMFYAQIGAYQLLNEVWGIPEWIHSNLMMGASNLLLGHALEAYFSGEYFGLWAVGAAMITSSFWWNDVRGGCIKLMSPLNWYIGVYLMWISITLGLPTAILARIPLGLILVIGNYIQAKIIKARKVI